MRESEFRAYHIGEKKMYYDVCVMFCPNELREYRIFEASDGDFLGNDKHFKITQYTGMKDRDEVKIFDGDIVIRYGVGLNGSMERRKREQEKVIYTSEVAWDEDNLVYWMGWENIGNYNGWGCIVVIGNKYENPELIDEKCLTLNECKKFDY